MREASAQFDWEAPRVKGTFVFSGLIPGLLSLSSYEMGMPWERAALLAMASGLVGGLVFGRNWKSRLLYMGPSVVTAFATVGVIWLVIRWQPSVPYIEVMLCNLVAAAGTLPLWAALYRRLETQQGAQAARRAAFLAATRRDG